MSETSRASTGPAAPRYTRQAMQPTIYSGGQPVPPDPSLASYFTKAQTLLGRNEVPDRAVIQEYLSNGGVNLDPATTAWCAAFINSTLQQEGYKGTGSNMARSFINYGEAVDKPQKGDIAVFSRENQPNGPFGHAGFFDGYDEDGKIRVLGGNQDNSVSYTSLDAARLLGFRRPIKGDGQTMIAQNSPSQVAPPAAPPVPFLPAAESAAPGLGETLASAFTLPQPAPQQNRVAQDDRVLAERKRKEALFDSVAGMFA